MTRVTVLLSLLLSILTCSSEVVDTETSSVVALAPGVYQRTWLRRGPDWYFGVYAFCDDADPAIRGECSGAPVIVERIETINTGRGHMFCYFEKAPGAVLRADVWCQGAEQ